MLWALLKNIRHIIYFEEFDDIEGAISREKQLKRWHRKWKLNLIKQANPSFKDLSEDFNGS
ncbi:MAG: Excinuclease ABC C subunit domain protein [Microgenomates group bacterium GW2011_GWC1_41_8]|uniref:Excinuclease ABC C subunit domain protein n=3 Tax=Candidatus Roizmaniibacteriota TaxID=1752723 RepID=A0A0G0X7Z0_9BACT|nr:MAG: Excinuclease ABC C subunit domain protein [Candidatus Roizmanbacteria bacterium GW2011_GWB1_40_7]KKR94191.1 MAG: Excinuclease ABC C subunit domain protein [Candidatus Roizmanbacteria bacterium GW2011_GWA1_41_13]KKS21154.1 MAG: Excinuclease ABC C subunit domain protein [Candidatus Roizmanbacteria bacterium GW2011_GWC2_41_7]KKS23946.1 MAG: Excinuclease ABC C subunit domain protein [Microgenomates group bacterium GW2011_GWC1_41_8]